MQYIGKEYDAVFCGVPIHIKIIGDDAVEKDFGTGALGVTPAHSQIDAEMATRHNIPTVQVINEFAKMMVGGENLLGKKVSEAKEIIVAWLNEEGLMEKEEDISQNVSTAERTGAIIEPLPKLQWFINVNKPIADRGNKTLKELMLGVVESKQVNILPDRYENVYYNWIRNLRDWCISRQIWYGHRIPVWYCIHCKMPHVELKPQANIYLIRHGQTDDNVNKIVAGSLTDTPLNEEGKKQAAAAGETIRNAKIDYIISSDMTRTRQTAEIIQSIAGGEIILDNELRERSYGVLEGTTFGSPAEKKDTKYVYGYHGKPENGESYKDVEDRVYNTFANHFNALEGKNVVFVTHGGSIRTLLRRLNNITEQEALDQKGVENATLLKLEVGPKCSDCGHKLYEQDPDTLDTWFSSGLWTFSTLGWPNQTDDLKNYHPTNVLETGHDILFFWVARMILMSTYLLGEVPFKTAYLHGLVRDEKGRKMSKSLGNIVDPLTLIDKYGTDALRMAMIVGVGPGSDSNLGEDKIKAYSKFANKLWNISRFVLENAGDANMDAAFDEEDQKSFDDLTALVSEVTKEMEEFKFYLVAEKLYHFAWHEFADIIIERCKTKIAEDNNAESAKKLLATILPILLKTLHPFMPYVTEELWSLLPATSGRMLMVEKWPC